MVPENRLLIYINFSLKNVLIGFDSGGGTEVAIFIGLCTLGFGCINMYFRKASLYSINVDILE